MQVIEDIFAETDRFINEEGNHRIRSWWFVTAHTINGGRFYSEPFQLFDDAVKVYDSYKKDVLPYFSGGYVELLRVNDYDYDVVSISRV